MWSSQLRKGFTHSFYDLNSYRYSERPWLVVSKGQDLNSWPPVQQTGTSPAVFWSLPHYKELKLTVKSFKSRTLRGLLIQMPNISLQSLGMCRKQNFEVVVVFKSDTAVLTFTFCFLSSPLFSLFLPRPFPFAGYLVGFILVRKVFRKVFKILELDERKGRQFSCKFSSQCYTAFCLFFRCPCEI